MTMDDAPDEYTLGARVEVKEVQRPIDQGESPDRAARV